MIGSDKEYNPMTDLENMVFQTRGKDYKSNDFEPLKRFEYTPYRFNCPRQFALELASKLRSSDGEVMTLKELTGKAEEILEWINKP